MKKLHAQSHVVPSVAGTVQSIRNVNVDESVDLDEMLDGGPLPMCPGDMHHHNCLLSPCTVANILDGETQGCVVREHQCMEQYCGGCHHYFIERIGEETRRLSKEECKYETYLLIHIDHTTITKPNALG